MMIDDERVSLMDVCHRLRLGVVASCNCNTKTPEIRYHNELCPTRLLEEGANEIARLRTKLATINMICAQAPPADELGEDNEIYDSILNGIQKQTLVGSTDSGEVKHD